MFKNKEYVLAIVREGGFSRAADKLYVSQPSLSATVKRIEEKLSLPIFDRTTTPITLTEAGKEYVRNAMDIERIERDFELYVSDRVGLSVGEVKIGGSSLFSSCVLPAMISGFNEKYPRVSVKIFENNTKNLMRELAEGNLDIVIDNAVIKNENITSVAYTSEMILLAVPTKFEINEKLFRFALSAADVKAGKHLSEEVTVNIGEFSSLPFVLLNSENDTGKRAENIFKKHRVVPSVLFRLDQQMTAYNVSCSGMGISFISDTLVKSLSPSDDVLYYRLDDDELTRNIYLYRKSKSYHSIACQKFMEYCVE